MTREQRQWFLTCAENKHRQIEFVLSRFGEILGEDDRLKIVYTKASLELAMDQLLGRDHESLA
jgi:hypothetical protein